MYHCNLIYNSKLEIYIISMNEYFNNKYRKYNKISIEINLNENIHNEQGVFVTVIIIFTIILGNVFRNYTFINYRQII